MFQTLHPLVIERSIHLLVSATKDGRMSVYVEPAKLYDNEEDAFVTPFRAQATPAELDAQLPAILAQWIASRQVANTSLAQQLADAEAAQKVAADEAKRKIAEKNKKAVTTATATSKPVVKVENKHSTPSLLDDPVAAPVTKAIPALAPALPLVEQTIASTEVTQVTPVAAQAVAELAVVVSAAVPMAVDSTTLAAAPVSGVGVDSAPVQTVESAASAVAPSSITTVISTPDLWD